MHVYMNQDHDIMLQWLWTLDISDPGLILAISAKENNLNSNKIIKRSINPTFN